MSATDPRTERMRAAGISEADEAYAWEALKTGDYGTHAGRLRIRAVAGFPQGGELDEPTMEEMIDCGLNEADAREYIDGWSAEDASASLDQSLAMSAACIAGARALDRADAVDTRVQQLTDALQLAAGALHSLFDHSATYHDCEVPTCVKERAALAEVDASPKEDA